MFLLLTYLLIASCEGPFVPPTGYDNYGNPFVMETEIAVGSENLETLKSRAEASLKRKVCGELRNCNPRLRVWETSSHDTTNCVVVISADKHQDLIAASQNLNARINSDDLTATDKKVDIGYSQVTSAIFLTAGILVGAVAFSSFADGIDGLYYEPLSPDVTLAGSLLSFGLSTVGITIYYVGGSNE